MNTDDLHHQLARLEAEKKAIEQKIHALKKKIERHSPFSKADKIALFRSLFIGNEEVYARQWISKDGSKSGYAPVPKTYKGTDYLPVTDGVIRQHLEGKIRMGSYAVRHQTMCRFLAIDLDKGSFVADARAIDVVSRGLGLSPLFELSKSGNGIHVWYFFEEDVRARDARLLGDLILSRAMDHSEGIDMGSFDRLFPNQDYVAPDALGNLIALPLHYGSRMEGRTVFVDIETLQPFADQWTVLQNVAKILPTQLQKLIADYAKATEETTLMPWEVTREALVLPRSIRLIVHHAIYIERAPLSKSFLNLLKRMASFYNPEFFIRQRQRFSTWNIPRIVSTYDLNARYIILPRGLLGKLTRFFEQHQVPFILEDKRLHRSAPANTLTVSLRPDQQQAMRALLWQDYALLIAPPGFGKTTIAAAVIARRKVTTLILVHKTILLEQWQKRLSEYYGIDPGAIGILGKGKKRLNGTLDVATLQSLKNRPDTIKNYTQIIIDEAHHIPAVSFEVPLKLFEGRYVLGLSATPRRKDGMEAIMYLQCGDVAHQAARQNTRRHTLRTVETAFDTFSDHFAVILGEIAEDEERNRLIIDEIHRLSHRKLLVLSERIEHLHILYHMLEETHTEAVLFYGGMKRRQKREEFEKAAEASIILSTTSYIGEGIDIGHLDTILLTMPVSYPERIVQYLGRIGRQGQSCLAIDFVDRAVPMLKNSFNKRMRGYKKMGYVAEERRSLF